jgi:riboflavin synthase
MFTGIVEESGIVHTVRATGGGMGLWVRARLGGRNVKPGDSVAVNGCCLTVEKIRPQAGGKLLQFSVLEETRRRTNLQFAKTGARVNLERALRAGDPLGGHFVAGHIDDMGVITRWEQSGKDYVLEVGAPPDIMRYVVFKGSIAVDGISLTIASARRKGFTVAIIPHTRAVTALRERRVGDAVNLEADMLGKFVERFVTARLKASGRPSGSAV